MKQQQLKQIRIVERQQIVKKTKKIRLIKKQIDTKTKTKTKTFAYRRYIVKYVNNIKLHQYIRDHHVKKSKTFMTFDSFSFHFASITLSSIILISITFFFSSMTSSKIT